MEGREGAELSRINMDEVLPPRLEDAGLEDCALPVESIHEAFLKAAIAVGSCGGSAFTSDEDDDNDDESSGLQIPEKFSDSFHDSPPALLHSDVVVESECAAKDGDNKGVSMRKGVDDVDEPSSVDLQKLEIR
ncbi:hypothetical protein SAY87_005991 [Trapa incisa]|uniref:Uncharacterized protein n=1 Tax=Trapa incisa TaxID=236973 RepID=A0AAN7K3Q7_9MYRT|nr:hypothetical protein SAY87_005991 [Trapa incisa]